MTILSGIDILPFVQHYVSTKRMFIACSLFVSIRGKKMLFDARLPWVSINSLSIFSLKIVST
jgi:hypothetical protein